MEDELATCTVDTFAPVPPAGLGYLGVSSASMGVQGISRLVSPLQAIPDPLWFAPTIDARLKIEKPFRVRIAHDGYVVTAVAQEIDEFGYGANAGDALWDLGKTIAELYFSLAGCGKTPLEYPIDTY